MLHEGEALKLPVLAKTLRDIAHHGAEIFYNGSVGDNFIEDIRSRGGNLLKKDLQQYR